MKGLRRLPCAGARLSYQRDRLGDAARESLHQSACRAHLRTLAACRGADGRKSIQRALMPTLRNAAASGKTARSCGRTRSGRYGVVCTAKTARRGTLALRGRRLLRTRANHRAAAGHATAIWLFREPASAAWFQSCWPTGQWRALQGTRASGAAATGGASRLRALKDLPECHPCGSAARDGLIRC